MSTIFKEIILKNKITGELKTKYEIQDFSTTSYEPLYFVDFSFDNKIKQDCIINAVEDIFVNSENISQEIFEDLDTELKHYSNCFSSIAKPEYFIDKKL